jgi:hypothetical protein
MLAQNLFPLLASEEAIAAFCEAPDQAHELVQALTAFLLLDWSGLLQAAQIPKTSLALYWTAHLLSFTQDVAFEACVDMRHTLERQFIVEPHRFSPPEEVNDILKLILCQTMSRPPAFLVCLVGG